MSVAANAYYPYDSGAGANVTESQWRTFMSRLHPSAVLANVNNELNPFGDSSGMQVKVDTGAAWVRGAYGEWTSIATLGIAAVGGIPGGQSRIDRVVVRNDFVANQMLLDVLTGTAGASPSPPTLTQSSSMWETLLADVGPLTNATSTITAAMVTDGRWKVTESGILYHEQTPTGVSSITLPAAGTIPSGYKILRVRYSLRTTSGTAGGDTLSGRINGDSGGNYFWREAFDGTGAWVWTTGSSDTSFRAGHAAGGGVVANQFNDGDLEIIDYAATKRKRIRIRCDRDDSSQGKELTTATYTQTGAVATLAMILGAGNYASSSRFVVDLEP